MTIDLLTFVAVDAGFHPIGVIGGGLALFYDEGDLPAVAVTGTIFLKKNSDPFLLQNRLNQRPRKLLGFRTPEEVYTEMTLAA